MSFVKSFLLFLAFAACSFVVATPHGIRSPHHRALVGRIAAPHIQDTSASLPIKRALRKRCKQRPGSSSKPAPPPAATVAPSSTKTKDEDQPKPTAPQDPPPPPPPPPSPSPTKTKTKADSPEPTTPTGGNGNLPSYMTGTQTGQGTFYDTGLGACGIVNTDDDFIAAVSHLLFDTFPDYKGGNPNKNPICGRKVEATYQGKSVVVALTDRCEGCKLTDLDFSPAAFARLAPFSVGRISGMTWRWL